MSIDFFKRELTPGDIVVFAKTPSSDYEVGTVYKLGNGTANVYYSKYGLTKRKNSNFLIKITEEDLLEAKCDSQTEGARVIRLSRTLKDIPLGDYDTFDNESEIKVLEAAMERIQRK